MERLLISTNKSHWAYQLKLKGRMPYLVCLLYYEFRKQIGTLKLLGTKIPSSYSLNEMWWSQYIKLQIQFCLSQLESFDAQFAVKSVLRDTS